MAARKTKIEFIPQEEWEKKPTGKFLKWALTVGRHIVIFTELIVILAFISRFKFDRDLSDLNEKIKEQQAAIISSAKFEEKFRFLQKRISTIEKFRKDQLEADKVLSELSHLIPIDVYLSNFKISKNNQVALTATALSEAGLATFLKNLNTSPRFTNLSISRLTSGENRGVGIRLDLTSELGTAKSASGE